MFEQFKKTSNKIEKGLNLEAPENLPMEPTLENLKKTNSWLKKINMTLAAMIAGGTIATNALANNIHSTEMESLPVTSISDQASTTKPGRIQLKQSPGSLANPLNQTREAIEYRTGHSQKNSPIHLNPNYSSFKTTGFQTPNSNPRNLSTDPNTFIGKSGTYNTPDGNMEIDNDVNSSQVYNGGGKINIGGYQNK